MSERKIIYPGRSEIKKLGQLMKEKFPEIVNSRVKDLLQQSGCPFTTALDILQKSVYKDYFSLTMCDIVCKNLKPYSTENAVVSEDIKRSAAALVCEFHKKVRSKIVRAFRLDQPDFVFIKTLAQEHLEKKEFKNFIAYHILFSLHDTELTEEVFIPMIGRGDNLDVVLKYADRSGETEARVIQAADRLIGALDLVNEEKLVRKLFMFLKIAKKWFPGSFSEANLQSFAAVLQNSEEKDQNYETKRLKRPVKYLTQWVFKEKSGSSLESLIFSFIGDDSTLLEEIANLIENELNDKKRADLLRQSLQPGSERTPIWKDDDEIPIIDHELKLAIPIENLFYVDSEKKLVDCFEYFKKLPEGKPLPIGFSSERTSSTSNPIKEDLALIQFAVNNRVYLIDFLYFQQNSMQLLTDFIKHIFQSDFYVILGFELEKDKSVLRKCFKNELWTATTRSLDFSKCEHLIFFSKVSKHFIFFKQIETKLTGLSKLCYRVLGKSLPKARQISDWTGKAPEANQTTHAAINVNCLVQMYHKYQELFEKNSCCLAHESLFEYYEHVLEKYTERLQELNGF